MKKSKYEQLVVQVKSLIEGETDETAVLANAAALLKTELGYHWIGFYTVKQDKLVLGPFQGPVACYRIGYGKGVCGTAWARRESVIVPDVDAFPGHIACSSLSRSEIVVPIFKGQEVAAVLDIDSDELNTFDDTDRKYLEDICLLISKALSYIK